MKILALAAVLLATTGTTSECGAELPKSCTVLFRGLKVDNGQVTDVLRPVCDSEHVPQNHKIHAWIEHKPFGGEWKQAGGRTPLVFDIPDEEGFDIAVSTKCKKAPTVAATKRSGVDLHCQVIRAATRSNTRTTGGPHASSPQATARDEHMKPAHGGYADYLPPQGLTWVWWQLQRPPKSIYRRVRKMYRRRWPPPEVSSYLGMQAMIVGEGATGRLHVGFVGVIFKSEVYGDHRVYHIEFEAESQTVVTHLPNPGCIELIPHENKS